MRYKTFNIKNLKSNSDLYFLVIWVHTDGMNKPSTKYSDRGDPNTNSQRQKSLGKLIKDGRDELGWTQKQLAEATGIKIHSIIKYEAIDNYGYGQYPKSQSLAKICLALKIDPLQALLACLPRQDFGMYESLSGSEAWKYNHPQYAWMEKQLASVTKDLMLFRSFLEHFLPYIDRENLPEELNWLLAKGETEFDRVTDLETRLLQMGVFILPLGHFLIPSGVTDEEGLQSFFDYGKPGIIRDEQMASVVERTLTFYAGRFVQLAHQFEHRDEEREKHADIIKMFDALKNNKGPEEDLPSPPSPDPKPTKPNLENDDGQAPE